MTAWYDRNTRKRHFSPGDEVLVLLPTESSKMTATWKGPFRIVRKLSDVNYQVNVGARRHGEHKVFYKASAKSVFLMLF
jgi:hypothetical protein